MIKQLADCQPQRARRNTEKIESSGSVELCVLCVLRGLKNNASLDLALDLTLPKAEQSAKDQAIS